MPQQSMYGPLCSSNQCMRYYTSAINAWSIRPQQLIYEALCLSFNGSSYHSTYRNRDHVFEERNDDIEFGQKLPIGAAVNKDVIGPAIEEERDILPPPSEEQPAARDPLYVVHYVPQEKEASSEKPPKDNGSDVLQKILSASKGTGKGTPQFVVFAPSPDDNDDEDDEEISPRVTRKRMKKRKKARKDMIEYDDDEYADHTQIKEKTVPRQRHGDYESSEYHNQQQHYSHNQQHHQPQQHMPCCNHQPMMTTAAPGLTIQMGQGLPASPLGMLRQLLRPKVDLRKKLFFGIQLENGMGFGGNTDQMMPAPQQPAMMPAQHQGGHQGGMGGGMGGQGQGMYRFG
ncbi:uncharacterized protein CDAR_374731 [Caerostris darwini]|uniref:Uncharacterized protein n=1 Tax=Caerostris darwini TaxID=1538125 RepID=A0AAV4P5G2_9ARAC|nr:uncharacterized protein CDAR_374731 [Caerostris darwini]